MKLFVSLICLLVPGLLLAVEATAEAAAPEVQGSMAYIKHVVYFACVTLAACIGAISQSKAVVVALENIGRNPGAQDKIFVPMILALALMESLVIIVFATIFV